MHKNYLKQAKELYTAADHMVYVTYPAINEPKILASVLETINKSLRKGIQSMVVFEQNNNRLTTMIPGKEIALFKTHCMQRYKFPPLVTQTVKDIESLKKAQKESHTEFTRKGKIIICTDDYTMREINEKMVKQYLETTRMFLKQVEAVING